MPQVNSSRMDLPVSAHSLRSVAAAASASATDGPESQMYTPKLKKVLRSYQTAATTSLMGPTHYQSSWSSPSPPSTSSSLKSSSSSTSVQSAPVAPTKVPLIVPQDESRCEYAETLLNGEVISCFVIGGEMWLCLPQVLNSVLKNSIEEIKNACSELCIYCSRCTTDQLQILKRKGILPVEATSCGLVTKTDAERLVASLVDCNPTQLSSLFSGHRSSLSADQSEPELSDFLSKSLSVAVWHDCFGKTQGLYRPDLYLTPVSPCIQCVQCSGMFSPQKFVAHSHKSRPTTRTCLWGFDSLNWRSYLLLSPDQSRANNSATSSKSLVDCCAIHRFKSVDNSRHQEELDRVLLEMRWRFSSSPDLPFYRHFVSQQAEALVNGNKRLKNSLPSLSPPAKRKEKETEESADGCDIVVEYTTADDEVKSQRIVIRGAKRFAISTPDADAPMLVMGVNGDKDDKSMRVIRCACRDRDLKDTSRTLVPSLDNWPWSHLHSPHYRLTAADHFRAFDWTSCRPPSHPQSWPVDVYGSSRKKSHSRRDHSSGGL